MSETPETTAKIQEVADRIHELREISGFTMEEMSVLTDVSVEQYYIYESGDVDLPFTFIHKCALAFGVGMVDLLEGRSAKLSSYTITRKGGGQITAREPGILIKNLAPQFRNKIAEPHYVRYEYSAAQQSSPIHLTTHVGQEFDMVISGQLKVQVGEHQEVLAEGDSIYYDSGTPHGMIAVGGADCVFLAVVLPGEEIGSKKAGETISATRQSEHLVWEDYVKTVEDEHGALQSLSFINEDKFNFAFDVVDKLAERKPDKLAMLHLDHNKVERRFTFADMKRLSAQYANYFTSLGIKRGDRVMLVLKRNWQFWPCVLAMHKLGVVMVPATDQLLEKDFDYRFRAAGISAIICTGQSQAAQEAERAAQSLGLPMLKIMANGQMEGWHDLDAESPMFSETFERKPDSPCGNDAMLMFFTSGTTGYPKIACHSYKYSLGHFITAKYWHCVEPDGLHFTISDTGWGKAFWGKIYGQWLCECAVFTYDFDRFHASDLLPLFKQHHITTFCAPPTMYRFMIKEDLSGYDLSSIKHACTAGEALNPEVSLQFKKATGLTIMEAFGQTETTLVIGNLVGMKAKVGSMGRPSPLFDVDLFDRDGRPVGVGDTGEIVIRTDEHIPCGLYKGYFNDENATAASWHDGYYHTGDTAWRDEDGYYWYVGRVDDLIKSSGYRIGPFEIESVLMELPYVLECGVSAAPDEVRGQVVKASIVLTRGTEGTDELKRQIQDYVKKRTAPYKYPRIIVFRDDLPKTISGKIQRNQL